jgi:hypothetical protein
VDVLSLLVWFLGGLVLLLARKYKGLPLPLKHPYPPNFPANKRPLLPAIPILPRIILLLGPRLSPLLIEAWFELWWDGVRHPDIR